MENLRTGEKIAGASGIALLLIMFILNWFTLDAGTADVGLNAFQSFGFIDLVLLLAAAAGIALAAVSANEMKVNLPVSLSAIAAGLGALGAVLVLFRILSPPDGGLGDLVDVGRGIGVFLGLIAVGGVAYGGFVAMQEEGTSFSDQRDRLQGGDDQPPPSPPPPAGPPAA